MLPSLPSSSGQAILQLPTQISADGCTDNTLPANDDGSTDAVALPFTVNFLGQSYGSLFINNNGNVTFDGPLSTYTPFPLTNTSHVIIAPFFGDVDTRGNGSGLVTYGATTYAGQPAFCVDWVNVGYYSGHTDKLNSFQLVLISRPDRNPGDFDIMFNYNQIQWETGDFSGGTGGLGGSSARVGYSNGVDTSFELPGSAVNGAFLDSNTATGLIYNDLNSTQPGRYVFAVQNGVAPTGGTISGGVFANNDTPADALGGAFVQVCGDSGFCQTTSTNAAGQYTVSGLADGQYTVTAFPPGGTSLFQGSIGPLTLSGAPTLSGQDIVLTGPTPPPPGTTITSIGTGTGGLPVVYWGDPLTLTTQGCAGGTASYEILQNGAVVRSGSMTEGPAGSYSAAIAPLMPVHGNAHVNMVIDCPDNSTTTIPFDIYIDPSGTVQTVEGTPIEGATVTLYRSDSSAGPFEPVPDGSGIMSLVNRNNPDTTDAEGHFGWDVVAGFYQVRASKAGCVSPADPSQAYVDSPVLTVPPAVTNLVLTLNCDSTPSTPIATAPDTATPTNTPIPPTDTPIPFTDTPLPIKPSALPTDTPVPPTATPTSTLIPPINTPLPTSTPIIPSAAPISPTSAPVPPTAAPQSLSQCPPGSTVPLALGRHPRGVHGGDVLALDIRTAPKASVLAKLQVTTTKLVTIGKGKHHKRVRRTIVLYQATQRGAADAHGRLTDRLRVAYKPGKPIGAGLTVTAQTGCGTVIHTDRVMIEPARSLPLSLGSVPRSVTSGHTLRLHLQALAHARISATLRVTTTRVVVTGKGKHRKRTVRTVVLYAVTREGAADARGRATLSLPVRYKPSKPAAGMLTATERAGGATTTRTAPVTIRP